MGLPELQVTAGDKGSSDGIVEHIFDPKLSYNTCLIVGNAKFFCHLMASFWGENIGGFDRSVKEMEYSSV